MNFWQDLRRRHVYRLVGFYIVGAWLVIQVADVFFPAWGVPDTALRYLIIAALFCFPIALVFGWKYDITRDGIVRTPAAMDKETVDLSLRRADYLILAALTAIGLAILAGSAQKVVEEIDAVATLEHPARVENSVAVLPFVNLDEKQDTGYFSDGVTEEILHRLSSLKALHILSRTSSFAFRDSDQGPARITEILGVRYLLHGSVRRDGNFVRVTARLIDETGYQVWSETFDRELEAIFVIQSEIASTVTNKVANVIIPISEQPAGRTTENMDAYNSYLVGRAFLNARTPGWQEKATAAFENSIELDPGYAPPYAGLAAAMTIANRDIESIYEVAMAAAEKSIELDPQLAEGHATLGLLLFASDVRDLPRAETSLRHAIDLDPSLSMAYNWLASVLSQQNRIAEYAAVQDQGLIVDPLNAPLTVNVANRYLQEGNRDRAVKLIQRLWYLPDPPGLAYWEMVTLRIDTGQFDLALDSTKPLIRAYHGTGDAASYSTMAWTYERLGMSEQADYWMSVALEISKNPVQQQLFPAFLMKMRGDNQGLRTIINNLDNMPNLDLAKIGGLPAAIYAASNIQAGDYQAGIEMFESAFGGETNTIVEQLGTLDGYEFMTNLAFGYRQFGRDNDADRLLQDVREQLEEIQSERTMHFAPFYELLAANRALRGDYVGTREALVDAISVGWRNYYWIVNDPVWAVALQRPEIAALMVDVRKDLEAQKQRVLDANADHDFRAEVERMIGR